MNSRLIILVKGELQRLNKYNMTSISILVAFLWGTVLFFLDSDLLAAILPMVLIVDATLMALMYVGSVMFFEKSESTISTLLVTPVTNNELLLSKFIANTLHNMLASLLIIIVFVIFKDVQINYFFILLGILVSTAFHTLLGVIMAYFQKDFTGMLVNVMIFSLILLIPTILFMLEVINGKAWEIVLLFNPIHAASELIGAGFSEYEFTYKYFFSLFYLVVGGTLGYKYYALPKFQSYAVKQSGV